MFCPFSHWTTNECMKEKCALWMTARDEKYSRCGIAEITRWAQKQNIKDAVRTRSEDKYPQPLD